MPTIGVFLLAIGAWVMYCGAFGMDPIAVAKAVLADPGNASKVISQARLAAASDAATNIGGGTVVGTGDGSTVVAYARAQIGKPYKLGGLGPDSFDCSGLTEMAYQQVGVQLPHHAAIQLTMGIPIASKSQLQIGDLLFPTGVGTALGDHVQIYSGNGNIIEAARPGTNVRERVMWGFSGDSVTARRYLKKSDLQKTLGKAGDAAGKAAGKSIGDQAVAGGKLTQAQIDKIAADAIKASKNGNGNG